MAKNKKTKTSKIIAKVFSVGNKLAQKVKLKKDFSKGHNDDETPSVLKPPFDPEKLYVTYEDSSLLPPNITAMQANVDGLGHRIVSHIEFSANDVNTLIRNALFEDYILNEEYNEKELEKIKSKKADGEITENKEVLSPLDFTEEEIKQRSTELHNQYILESIRGEAFFRNCCTNMSFTKLRKITRGDLEITGNGYWEVLRDNQNRMKKFNRIHPSLARISNLSSKLKTVVSYERVSQLTVRKTTVKKYVRSFKIGSGSAGVWMKELGCEQIISGKTGQYFKDLKAFKRYQQLNDPEDFAGHEIIHFKLNSNTISPYGVPRWIGALTEVMGSRGASVYNQRFFSDGFLDPKLLMVNGGTLTPDSIHVIKDFLENMKGAENAHKILLLEATSSSGQVVPQIKFEDVKNMKSETDAGWLKYDARNEEKVGAQFRIPKIIRGITDGAYNRATSDNAMKQADEQVFSPLRKDFDWEMNRLVLPEIGLNMSKFVSNGVDSTDTELMGNLIKGFVSESIITPSEARELSESVFNFQFSSIEDEWVNYPPKIYVTGLLGRGTSTSSVEPPEVANEDADDSEVNMKKEVTRIITEGRRALSLLAGNQAKRLLNGDD